LTRDAPNQDRFAISKIVELKIVRTDDELQVTINKVDGPKKKFAKKELDGKIGFLISTNARVKIKRLRITGTVVKP